MLIHRIQSNAKTIGKIISVAKRLKIPKFQVNHTPKQLLSYFYRFGITVKRNTTTTKLPCNTVILPGMGKFGYFNARYKKGVEIII
ncbi:hypothetical protein AHMF7605_09430 [Adhaeribacter arboris]|uniref:Uncharacterized protein n=1 Tax=Adhaeribacter arboris TaxID=2072846 RepID=A0A2T2YDZ2_9BACT|nr:hypothetical protein AHMF7605_09430 [Adhaeribacter arboris]